MKTSNLTWAFITFGLMLLLWLMLPTAEPNPETYILHYPNGIDVDTVQVADSTWYPTDKPIPPHTWEWMEAVNQPINSKLE